jgi:hypothetical protein
MKTFLYALCVSAGLLFSAGIHAAETKEVCVDKTTKDGKPVKGKDGKTAQTCKTIKVHKKLEGTAVPEKK